MRPIAFVVHSGDLDELVRQSLVWSDEEANKYVEAVRHLDDYLKGEFLGDPRARQVCENVANNGFKPGTVHQNIQLAIEGGADKSYLFSQALARINSYESKPKLGINGLMFLAHFAKQRLTPVEMEASIGICNDLTEKSMAQNDIFTGYVALNLGDLFRRGMQSLEDHFKIPSDETISNKQSMAYHEQLHQLCLNEAAEQGVDIDNLLELLANRDVKAFTSIQPASEYLELVQKGFQRYLFETFSPDNAQFLSYTSEILVIARQALNIAPSASVINFSS